MSSDLEVKFEHETWYHAQVDECRFAESGGKNTPGIILKWSVVDGELMGRAIIDERWIAKGNAERHVKEFEILGFDRTKHRLSQMANVVIGQKADILCRIEEFPKNSGIYTPKVGRIKPPGAGGEDKLIARLEELIGVQVAESESDEKFEKQF